MDPEQWLTDQGYAVSFCGGNSWGGEDVEDDYHFLVTKDDERHVARRLQTIAHKLGWES